MSAARGVLRATQSPSYHISRGPDAGHAPRQPSLEVSEDDRSAWPRPIRRDNRGCHAVVNGEFWSKSHCMLPLIQRPDNQSDRAAKDFPGRVQHFLGPEGLQLSGLPSR